MTELKLSALVSSTAEPAFATDSRGRIVSWNPQAERLFGYSEGKVLGRHCYELFLGKDEFGNLYCNKNCPLILMALKH